MTNDYTHHEIGKEVHFAAGHYEIVEEGLLIHEGKEFIYLLGVATVDNACCGHTGCRFLFIPGYVHSWKTKTNCRGRIISEVEPIIDVQKQSAIRAFLAACYPHSQISFSGG
ncbi:MAG: hypothetical protein CVU54_10850 [Deltaproteobacteria bacterium HGW-Deltaproteobacteria-12]|nr:MAG: hypothetical protein CVU54_10850 [Deltaproteobacteria bacterium HGW-Deltaproteobacteria-12]